MKKLTHGHQMDNTALGNYTLLGIVYMPFSEG
jgi:hypothetical protein